MNLTHSEAAENFPARYGAEEERWRELLGEFGSAELQAWAHSLGIETYVGSSGRVFPEGQKAAGLLRAWTERLRANGVQFQTGARCMALERAEKGWRVCFEQGERDAKAVVLACGGASWPETGSDGMWPAMLRPLGVEMTPWQPANCGWEVNWSQPFRERAEGKPLKNLTVSAGPESVSGELLVTKYGLEGGAIYRLGRVLRGMDEPTLMIDFKPQLTVENLRERAAQVNGASEWLRAWKLNSAATALLETDGESYPDLETTIDRVKNFKLPLERPTDRGSHFIGRWSAVARTGREVNVAKSAGDLRGRRDDRLGSADWWLSVAGMLRDGHARGGKRGQVCS